MSATAIHASAVLRRRAIADDLGLDAHHDAYWAAAPRLYDFSKHHLFNHHHHHHDDHDDKLDLKPEHDDLDPKPEHDQDLPKPEQKRDLAKKEHQRDPAPRPDPLPPAPSPRAPSPAPPPRKPTSAHLCLLALQGTGLGWGVRKRVRYVTRHRAARHDDRRARLSPAVVAENPHDRRPAPATAVHESADADEGSSSNVKTKDLLGLLGETRRRVRKPAPAPKLEVFEDADAGPEAESDRKVAARADKAKRKRKDVRRRGRGVAKRAKKAAPPVPEVERKVVKAEKKRCPPEEEEEERKVVKKEKKTNLPEQKKDERTAVKAERKRGPPEEERTAVVLVAVKRERKSKAPLRGRAVTVTEEPETKPPRAGVKAEEAAAAAAALAAAPRGMVDRWTATRYAAAEASLLGVLRRFGARPGKTVPRGELRQAARKHVGDTGLLDHLLKHTADKVPRGSAERIRRRHTADGTMEYWLEPAELAALRREVGVDPYWVPPPGWKRGDPVSADGYALKAKKQVEELTKELAGVKRHMQQLVKAHQGTMNNEVKPEAPKACISHDPYQDKYECVLKANGNLEKQVLSLEEKYAGATRSNGKLEQEVLFLKEKYEAVLEKNSRLEQQVAALSTSFLSLKEGMQFLNDGEQQQQQQQLRIMGAEPRLLLCARECRQADRQEPSNGAGDQLADGGRRREWPHEAQPSSPRTPTAARVASVDDDGCAMDGGLELPPTPPSASSTNAASSAKLLLLPAPDSPVQPPPQPPATSSSSARVDVGLQEPAESRSGGLDLQLRHTAQDATASLPFPCGAAAGLPEGGKTATAGGRGRVGTELALATPSY
ncbi:protein AMEIOTIC 1 homolog [Triticum dicoccoides]|uniref:protein AMEIOTIC 1 homolog n=1 Tax=Triticum dicoccoides TaxID=85692 RepID=UPI001891D4E7|nr:protein AMEIOTIC 1 homolog [Triticum dicoccoides]